MTKNRITSDNQVEQYLRTLVEHRWRAVIVITVTFAIGLITIWPAADEYFALRSYDEELVRSLRDARREVDSLGALESRVLAQEQVLASLEAKAVNTDDTYEFREQLVELAREAGCRLRRLDLGHVERRPWEKGDDPLEPVTGEKQDLITQFELTTQPVRLAVAGPMESVADFLNRIQESDKMIHTTTVTMRAAPGSSEDVELEMELLIFNLSKKPQAV